MRFDPRQLRSHRHTHSRPILFSPRRALGVALVALGLGPFSVAHSKAEQHVLQLTPETTEITFLLEATAHDVEGLFELEDGRIVFDSDGGEASGTLRIDARRADTGNARRDKEMHTEVLESQSHPWIVFTAERLEGEVPDTGSGEVALVGQVELLGRSHALRMPIELEVDGDQVQATTTFAVPFVAWGLHDPSMWLLKVAKEVQVTVETSGTLQAVPSADEAASDAVSSDAVSSDAASADTASSDADQTTGGR
ncbi:MAG: YceI family protein [Acidobacteriota bacterium]